MKEREKINEGCGSFWEHLSQPSTLGTEHNINQIVVLEK